MRPSARLFNECASLAVGETITLIGVPSIFREARKRDYSRGVHLLGCHGPMLQCLTAHALADDCLIPCDVHDDPLPDLSVPVVVLDPPWYDADARSFL